MKKILLLLIFQALFLPRISGQQLYTDFEGADISWFGFSTGMLDSLSPNPGVNAVDSSSTCAKYIRDTALYDFIRIYPLSKMENVSSYATNAFGAPKIKLKIFCNMPAGTPIIIQLGARSNDSYPSGIHSEYIGASAVQNSWHLITFNFYQVPAGSTTLPTDVDKMVILFRPNSSTTDTIYFDDLMGPPLITPGISGPEAPPFRLFQNSPNPSSGQTRINFQLGSAAHVSLSLMDILGNPVSVLIEEQMKPGMYSIPVDTGEMPEGIYFYVFKMNGITRSMKMIVSR